MDCHTRTCWSNSVDAATDYFVRSAKKSPPQAGQEPAEGEVVGEFCPPNYTLILASGGLAAIV